MDELNENLNKEIVSIKKNIEITKQEPDRKE